MLIQAAALVREIAHNPERYPDPMSFKPERFLKTEVHEPELDPRSYAFGYGRRYEFSA